MDDTRRHRAARLIFLAPGDVLKGRVEPISWMRTCQAFAQRGLHVRLVVPRIRRTDGVPPAEVWRHFGIAPAFRIQVLPTPLRHDSSTLAFRMWGGLAGALFALGQIVRQALRPTTLIVYSRTPIMVLPFLAMRRLLPSARRPVIVFETHTLPNRFGDRATAAADLVVVTSERLRRDLIRVHPRAADRIVLCPLGPFNGIHPIARNDARNQLGLSCDVPIAVYTGKMFEEQNAFFLETAAELRKRVPNAKLMLVGGNPRILEWTHRMIAAHDLGDCMIVTGFVDPASVNVYQAAADVLIFHMSESLLHWQYCTPAKAFEYQAARRPIVATDLPLFDEVFGEPGERAIRVTERTPAALGEAIAATLTLDDQGRRMAERAVAWVSRRTWNARVDAVLRALNDEG